MKSSGLALTVLTLVGTLAVLDLSGAHQLPTQHADNTKVSMSRIGEAQAEESIKARLINSLMETPSSKSTLSIGQGRAVHRCVTDSAASSVGPMEYCFGAHAVEIDYD